MATAASPRFSSRGRLLAAAAAATLLAVVAVGAYLVVRDDPADERRAAVERYIETVNAVQRGSAIELDKMSRTYEGMRLDPVELSGQQAELAEAETTMRRLRATMGRIVPPPEAERVHAELLELLEMQVQLSAEMSQLAVYVPLWAEQAKGLEAATTRLRRDLREARTSDDQRRAFERYTTGVGRAGRALSGLVAPAVLEPPRRQEIARLQRVHGLAAELREAAGGESPELVETLFDRLADASSTANANRTQRAAVAAYNRRIERLTAQRTSVESELARLAEQLG